MADRLTALPVQQTATQVARLGAVENAQIIATQTAIAGNVMNEQLANQATRTAMALNQEKSILSAGATATTIAQDRAREQTSGVASLVFVGIGILTLCVWIVTRAFVQAVSAQAQKELAHAQLLAEQRRLASLRASLQNQNGHKPSHIIPTSLVQGVGDVDKMPKAE
jgi:hypothetical protein